MMMITMVMMTKTAIRMMMNLLIHDTIAEALKGVKKYQVKAKSVYEPSGSSGWTLSWFL